MPDGDDDRRRRFISRLRPAVRNIEPSSSAKVADEDVRGVDAPLPSSVPNSGETQKRDRRLDRATDPAALKALHREARKQVRENRKQRDISQDVEILAPLPQRRGHRPHAAIISFFIVVVVPTILATIYYYGIASRQYVSEFRFAVSDTNTTSNTMGSLAGLSTMLSASPAQTPLQSYMVADFLTSPQAVIELEKKLPLVALYSNPDIDWWSRFNSARSKEQFLLYWQGKVTAKFDQMTGLVTAEVRAFTAEDAYEIANNLVTLAENLVNDVARRPALEAVRSAEREVKRAEEKLKSVRAELTKYRNKESVIDPTPSAVTSNLTLALTLRSNLMQLQNELDVLRKQGLGPKAASVVTAEKRINATKEQLAGLESQVSKNRDGNERPLSEVVGDYEQLDLERQFAQNMVTSTMQSLEQARATLLSQRLFVTPYVRPALPQSSAYPNRFTSVLVVLAASVLIWIAGFMTVRSIRDHAL